MMLGYLLARAGVQVTVLEKHADFLRDFRGDTVHPSTLAILDQCGLKNKFDTLPQSKVQEASVHIGKKHFRIADFRGLNPFDYIALVPQWDFLDLLASEGQKLNNFNLLMSTEATDVIREPAPSDQEVVSSKVVGVVANTPNGTLEIRADLVVGCDGRRSTVRSTLGLKVLDLGAPMDVLWFKLPREKSDDGGLTAVLGAGDMMIMINRNTYYQAAYIVPKGSDSTIRKLPISELHQRIVKLRPFLKDRCSAIGSWDDVKTLVVTIDRLEQWCEPGALVIGDAAHAMSPVGGVGINLAIQDAVAAANIITAAIGNAEPLTTEVLARVQKRRQRPTERIQRLQMLAQDRVVSAALEAKNELPKLPVVLRFMIGFKWFRKIPARVIGYGFNRERVECLGKTNVPTS